MDHEGVAKEWFQYAYTDLEAAKFLLTMRPAPLEIICYHCQQSSEKYLKGFIALNGSNIQKTHDLVSLNKMCENHHSKFAEILNDCINLTDYGIQTRYPFELDINENDVLLAIKSAENIQKFIKRIIE